MHTDDHRQLSIRQKRPSNKWNVSNNISRFYHESSSACYHQTKKKTTFITRLDTNTISVANKPSTTTQRYTTTKINDFFHLSDSSTTGFDFSYMYSTRHTIKSLKWMTRRKSILTCSNNQLVTQQLLQPEHSHTDPIHKMNHSLWTIHA